MRDELGADERPRPKHGRFIEHGDEFGSSAGSLGGSPQIGSQPPNSGMGSRRVPRDGEGGCPIFGVGR